MSVATMPPQATIPVSTAMAVPNAMTIAEFNALPDDPSKDRVLIRGQLREKSMTRRNRWHSETESMIAHRLIQWLEQSPPDFGRVFSGEIGCELPAIGSSVGIDVALFSSETLRQLNPKAKYIVGPPILAVEILSPSDTQEDILLKVRDYLDSDVKLVWVVEPWFQTVTVYRTDSGPEMFHGEDKLIGDPHLPGLQLRVADIFAGHENG